MTGLGQKLTITMLSLVPFCGTLFAADEFQVLAPASTLLQIHYNLTGPFGGYTSFSNRSSADGVYRIPLEHNGQAATALRIIAFTPGCQIATFAFGIADPARHSATFVCEPLPTITLNGRIELPLGDTSALDLVVDYHSPWDHAFFRIFDGMTGSFRLGAFPVAADGRFSIQIPDFSKDRVTAEMRDAFLSAHLAHRSTLNRVDDLTPPPPLTSGSGFKILSSYPQELLFSRRR